MNKTILIIDDDDILRETLAHGLRENGFTVLTANSASSGSKVLSRVIVDAVVLDRMMTGMDGLTFLKQLRSDGFSTPVIMLTAMSGAENTIDGLSCGANDYLSKPFQLRELVLRLNNIIRVESVLTKRLPGGLIFTDGEFFVMNPEGQDNSSQMLALSTAEKKLLRNLITPFGNIVPAAPMVAKRLRNKLNGVLSDTDIVTIRGRGYKLIRTSPEYNKTNGDIK